MSVLSCGRPCHTFIPIILRCLLLCNVLVGGAQLERSLILHSLHHGIVDH